MQGSSKNRTAAPNTLQNRKKTGRSHRPKLHSQATPPRTMAAKAQSRRSAWQMPNITYSQPQKAPGRNSRSLRVVCRGRKGRRKPYHTPSRIPTKKLERNRRAARTGAVIPAAAAS
ncbi:MAG: hypothetical protein IJN20_08590 [Oscillospiraceae bacterium]|nr:hypothetical protein [Oscillospiraceae bacterium]